MALKPYWQQFEESLRYAEQSESLDEDANPEHTIYGAETVLAGWRHDGTSSGGIPTRLFGRADRPVRNGGALLRSFNTRRFPSAQPPGLDYLSFHDTNHRKNKRA